MNTQDRRQKSRISGFTLDQTILVVAVIAVLATIIISSVAWSVLNRANATRIASHLSQVANSIGSHYQDNYHEWPSNASDLAPYLAGYTISGDDLITPLGGTSKKPSLLKLNEAGGKLSEGGTEAKDCETKDHDCYITITVSEIPAQEAEEANNAIDGDAENAGVKDDEEDKPGAKKGRLRWTSGAGSKKVTITYFAVKKPR